LYHLDISKTAPLVKSGIIAIAIFVTNFTYYYWRFNWQKRNKTAASLLHL